MNNPKKKLRSHPQGFPRGAPVKESTCQCRGQEFDPCSGKTPHATHRTAKSQLLSLCFRAQDPKPKPACHKYWSPQAKKSMLCNERPPKWEACTPHERAGSTRRNYRKALAAMKAQHNQNKNKNKNKKHFHSQYHQNKILRNKLNKSGVTLNTLKISFAERFFF